MEKVTLTVPFVYQASGTQGRERKAREIMFGSHIDIEITFAADAEAPVALRYKESDSIYDADEPKQIEYRVVDNQFYKPYARDPAKSEFELLSDMSLTKGNSNPFIRHSAHAHLAAHRWGFERFGRDLPMSEEGYSVSSSDREEQERDLQNIADNYLVVDGRIWRKCAYPVFNLSIETDYPYKRAKVTAETIDPFARKEAGRPVRNLYRVDQFDFLLESAQESLAQHHDPEKTRLRSEISDVEVFIPEAFWFNPDIEDFIGFAEYVLKDDEKDILRQGRDVTNAWHDVSDAVIAVNRSRSDEDLEKLMQSLATLVDFKREKQYRNDTLIDWFSDFEKRFENRPIGDQPAGYGI
jgi:hypothetical protein